MSRFPPCFWCGLVGTWEGMRFGLVSVLVHRARRIFCGVCWYSYMAGHDR